MIVWKTIANKQYFISTIKEFTDKTFNFGNDSYIESMLFHSALAMSSNFRKPIK